MAAGGRLDAVRNNLWAVPEFGRFDDMIPLMDTPAKQIVFDFCASNAGISNFERAKQQYAQNGYALPAAIFWNVASRNQQQPVTMNEQGVALVSGASPRVFSMLSAGVLSPMAFMLDTLGAERYAAIVA
jgi:hypothetical protein